MCGTKIQGIFLDETCLEGSTEADWNVHWGDREESERRRGAPTSSAKEGPNPRRLNGVAS